MCTGKTFTSLSCSGQLLATILSKLKKMGTRMYSKDGDFFVYVNFFTMHIHYIQPIQKSDFLKNYTEIY